MSNPNARYRADRTIRAGRSKLAGWSPGDVAMVAGRHLGNGEYEAVPAHPTPAEMRRVAGYLADVMGLHSAAGKLLARADKLERSRSWPSK